MTEAPFEVSYRTSDQGAIVTVSGDLDISTVPTLEAQLKEATQQSSALLTLDLRRVTYIDSIGLSLLITLYKRQTAAGSGLAVYALPGSQPDRVVSLSGFSSLLNLSSGLEPK